MANILIKKDDVVTIHNYNSNCRYNRYIGKVINIVLSGGVEVDEQNCVVGMGQTNTKAKIKVKPILNLSNAYHWDNRLPTPITEDLEYLENPTDITILTPEMYENQKKTFLTKLNFLSNVIYGYNEFNFDIAKKPKKFKI